MTASISPDYFFITAIPTPIWSRVIGYCQGQLRHDGRLASYHLDAQAGVAIDVKPFRGDGGSPEELPAGTFFSERYHEHTCTDVVQAVREGSLDHKVLTYPEFLSGHDTMIVFFWPEENELHEGRIRNDEHVNRKASQLFEELVAQTIHHF